jgi:acetyl-CoA carboxylase biotin carboxyl carrier protein
MNLNEIQDLIKFVSKSGVSEVEIEQKDFKIVIKANGKGMVTTAAPLVQQQIPVAIPQAVAPVVASVAETPKANTPVEDDSKYITVKSPMIGTFYRSAGPDKPVFVNVGDTIKKGDKICIIEAMKLFNEIEAEVSGKIVKVLTDDAKPVEYDQPLFLVEPA